jgi:hypothetical protein
MRARVFRAAALAAIVAVAAPVAVSTGAEPASPRPRGPVVDLVPDLVMAKPYGWYLEERPSGKTWLRFGTIAWNVGDGPLEIRARRLDPGDDTMVVRQRIYDSAGGRRSHQTTSLMIYEGNDGHTHWHLRRFIDIDLYKANQPKPEVLGARKLGYCLLDAVRKNQPPPGSPAQPVYPLDACGHPNSQSLLEGLSVGWGDDYPPNFAHQWMDITGLETGRYRMCLTVDPQSEFEEISEENNQRWVDVRINIPNDRVVVKATGTEACGPGIF